MTLAGIPVRHSVRTEEVMTTIAYEKQTLKGRCSTLYMHSTVVCIRFVRSLRCVSVTSQRCRRQRRLAPFGEQPKEELPKSEVTKAQREAMEIADVSAKARHFDEDMIFEPPRKAAKTDEPVTAVPEQVQVHPHQVSQEAVLTELRLQEARTHPCKCGCERILLVALNEMRCTCRMCGEGRCQLQLDTESGRRSGFCYLCRTSCRFALSGRPLVTDSEDSESTGS